MALFAQCVREFFAPVDNQRYLLVKEGTRSGADRFYCVPECFGKKKEDAGAWQQTGTVYFPQEGKSRIGVVRCKGHVMQEKEQ